MSTAAVIMIVITVIAIIASSIVAFNKEYTEDSSGYFNAIVWQVITLLNVIFFWPK